MFGGKMIKDYNNFLWKQALVQKLLKNYRSELCDGLYRNGYCSRENKDNYVILIARRKGNVIALPGLGDKIYYGNIMPDTLDLIMPLDDEPVNKAGLEAQLRQIAGEMSQHDIASFAFEKRLSLSILGTEFNYEKSTCSIYIPISAFGSGESLLPKIEGCIKPKKKKKRWLFF